jgi:hypothetical protein
LAKNGSLGFAEGWLVSLAKPNVPFVLLVSSFFVFPLLLSLSLSI